MNALWALIPVGLLALVWLIVRAIGDPPIYPGSMMPNLTTPTEPEDVTHAR